LKKIGPLPEKGRFSRMWDGVKSLGSRRKKKFPHKKARHEWEWN
jgi:hypothetical protein